MAATPSRNKMIAKIKVGAKALGLDDATYRDFLTLHGGKDSCATLTDAGLRKVLSAMDAKGGFADGGQKPKAARRSGKGGRGPGRPTDAQDRKLAALARDMGWDGLDDPRLTAFITRTTGIDDRRFLTRKAMTDVITGLEKWKDESR